MTRGGWRALLLALALAGPARAQTPVAPQGPPPPTPPWQLAPFPSTHLPVPPRTDDVPTYWKTRAEKTGYRSTADLEETLRFWGLLEARSRWIKVTSYGRSGRGRGLPLVIVSKDQAFTPEQARATGKPVVLIQNGIHAGEIEGKDACLELLRDMVVMQQHRALLDSVILVILPVFSVDAHEQASHFNRINQNGPEMMGWRYTPIGLNLNRDYLKVETPEMRAFIANVYTKWWPHLLIDNHTTNGADYRHDLTYSFNRGPGVPAAVDRWLTEAIEGRVVGRTRQMGHLTAPYMDFVRGNDPGSGVVWLNATPRLSTGYTPLHGRPSLLVETHMLKPYGIRVRATYDMMLAVLEEIHARPGALLAVVATAEAEALARGRTSPASRAEVVLQTRVGERRDSLEFKGWRTHWEPSVITGIPVPHYTDAPWDTMVPYYRTVEPALTVHQPAGYLVPQEWTAAIDRLDIHAVAYRRLAAVWRDTVEVQRIVAWSAAPRASEGHRGITASRVVLERRAREFSPGDVWVPLDQRSAAVAVHLFEAQAPDGLLHWNVFDTVLEPKEYGEAYVMESVARRMMREDPALAADFRARLAADSTFARSPEARVDYFYRRSPWGDPERDLHPVARALRPPPESVLVRR